MTNNANLLVLSYQYKEGISMTEHNDTAKKIILHMIVAAIALFVNGFGVYLTIHADIGAGPWDVFNLGLSKTLGILYGTASIAVSIAILIIDIILREPIGIAMFIDALTVGKSVDLFNFLDFIPVPKTIAGSIVMMICGLFIMGFTQYFYMKSALGCGPRDTLLVGLKRRSKKIPIGVISIALLSVVTLTGYLLGGKVGIGTLICAFLTGPIMQIAFKIVKFDATGITHQSIINTFYILFGKKRK